MSTSVKKLLHPLVAKERNLILAKILMKKYDILMDDLHKMKQTSKVLEMATIAKEMSIELDRKAHFTHELKAELLEKYETVYLNLVKRMEKEKSGTQDGKVVAVGGSRKKGSNGSKGSKK